MSLRRASLAQRRGFWGRRSLSGMLLPAWVEDPTPVVESIRRCGRLDTIEAVLPDSDDSWNRFRGKHWSLIDQDMTDVTASGSRYGEAPARPTSAAPARLQQAYEVERAARRREDAAASAEQWRREELRRRDLAAAVGIEHRFAAEQERERLDTVARLALTEQGGLTPVYWQTEALYRVEGARRALRASRG